MDVLQRCPASDSEDSTAKPDFTAATHGIMGVLHQIMQVHPPTCDTLVVMNDRQRDGVLRLFCFLQGHHEVEGAWQHRKLRLHQRLQLCVFQQDVRQVRHTRGLIAGVRCVVLRPTVRCIPLSPSGARLGGAAR